MQFDADDAERKLRAYCADNDIDLDRLLREAAPLFAGPLRAQYASLTAQDIAELVAEDERLFGRSA